MASEVEIASWVGFCLVVLKIAAATFAICRRIM